MTSRPRLLPPILGVMLLALAGCRAREEIGEYQAPKPQPPLKYTRPDGWREKPGLGPGGLALLSLLVNDGAEMAEVTVTTFPGRAGGELANVNRWRGQLFLPPIDEDQLKKDATAIKVDGVEGRFVDLLGPDEPGRQRTLGVMLTRKDQTWFFKMKGSPDLVGRQKPAFEAFVRSVRFGEARGNRDE